MRLEVDPSVLAAELEQVCRCVGKGDAIPIVGHVKLQAKDGALLLAGTDMDISLTTSCAAEVKKPGTAILPAVELQKIVRTLTDPLVIEKASEGWFTLTSGGTRVKMPGLDEQDFPVLFGLGGEEPTVPAEKLREVLALVVSTSRVDKNRDTVRLTVGPGAVTAISTSGHALAFAKTAGPEDARALDLTVPAKTVGVLLSLLDGATGPVGIGTVEQSIYFTVADRVLRSRTPVNPLPDMTRVFDAERNYQGPAVVSRQDLLAALRRVSVLATGKALKLSLRDGRVDMSTSGERGEASDTITAHYEGPDIDFGINIGYLTDFAQTASGDQLSMRISGPETAAYMRPVYGASPGAEHLYIVMPMRLI